MKTLKRFELNISWIETKFYYSIIEVNWKMSTQMVLQHAKIHIKPELSDLWNQDSIVLSERIWGVRQCVRLLPLLTEARARRLSAFSWGCKIIRRLINITQGAQTQMPGGGEPENIRGAAHLFNHFVRRRTAQSWQRMPTESSLSFKGEEVTATNWCAPSYLKGHLLL